MGAARPQSLGGASAPSKGAGDGHRALSTWRVAGGPSHLGCLSICQVKADLGLEAQRRAYGQWNSTEEGRVLQLPNLCLGWMQGGVGVVRPPVGGQQSPSSLALQ